MSYIVKKQAAFTIVELLIVIVVIAILATISVVAYNGIQERTKNAKTIAAVREWAQIIRMYKADNGEYPMSSSCLGGGYGKGFSGNDSSGPECRQDTASDSGWYVSSAFTTAMSEYIKSGTPTPSFVTAGSASYPWYRGAYYAAGYTGTKDRIDFILAGSSTTCPSIAGLVYLGGAGIFGSTNSVRCLAFFPDSKY